MASTNRCWSGPDAPQALDGLRPFATEEIVECITARLRDDPTFGPLEPGDVAPYDDLRASE